MSPTSVCSVTDWKGDVNSVISLSWQRDGCALGNICQQKAKRENVFPRFIFPSTPKHSTTHFTADWRRTCEQRHWLDCRIHSPFSWKIRDCVFDWRIYFGEVCKQNCWWNLYASIACLTWIENEWERKWVGWDEEQDNWRLWNPASTLLRGRSNYCSRGCS